jgi:hypothetical protein
MHIHILGICGTFMGGIAAIARAAGHRVTGCDAGVYPPMSTQLERQGISLVEGYSPDQIDLKPDLFVIGNVVARGNALMEELLNRGLPYVSGPQWLRDNVLAGRWVVAVAGTHGKTTTSAMVAWILEDAGLSPGFLIGGVPENFGVSARLSGAVSTPTLTLPPQGGGNEAALPTAGGGLDRRSFLLGGGGLENSSFPPGGGGLDRSSFPSGGGGLESSFPGGEVGMGEKVTFHLLRDRGRRVTPRSSTNAPSSSLPAAHGVNNLEFDHADIFPDVGAIERSFTIWCAPFRG